MADASALSSAIPPSAENGDMDAGPSVARRRHTQPAGRGRRKLRAMAWAKKIRCLQAPPQLGHLQRRRRLCRRREPVVADRRGRSFPTPSDRAGNAGGRRNGHCNAYLRRWRPRAQVGNMCKMGADTPWCRAASMPSPLVGGHTTIK